MKRKNLIKGALILFALGGLYISSATFNASASGFFTGTGPTLPPLVTAPPSSACTAKYEPEEHNSTFLSQTMEDCYSCTYSDAKPSPRDTIRNEITYTYVATEGKQSMVKINCIETPDYNDVCTVLTFTGSKEAIINCQDFSWTQPAN